jgi:hypothetical protein
MYVHLNCIQCQGKSVLIFFKFREIFLILFLGEWLLEPLYYFVFDFYTVLQFLHYLGQLLDSIIQDVCH